MKTGYNEGHGSWDHGDAAVGVWVLEEPRNRCSWLRLGVSNKTPLYLWLSNSKISKLTTKKKPAWIQDQIQRQDITHHQSNVQQRRKLAPRNLYSLIVTCCGCRVFHSVWNRLALVLSWIKVLGDSPSLNPCPILRSTSKDNYSHYSVLTWITLSDLVTGHDKNHLWMRQDLWNLLVNKTILVF